MKLAIGGGVEVDLATVPELEAMLDDRFPRPYPLHPDEPQRYRKNMVTVQAPASGPAIMKLGSPEAGRQYNVASIVVVGADDHTTVANASPALYIGEQSAFAPGGLPPLGDLFLAGNQGGSVVGVPTTIQPGSKRMVVVSPDDIYLAITGAAGGTSLTAVMWFWDEPIVDLGYN